MSEAQGNGSTPIPTSYGVTRSRRHESGLLALRVAGPPGTPPEIVRVHAGLDTLDINFQADQLSAPPTVPHPDLADDNSILLGGAQIVTLPMIQPQGNHAWSISGQYLYVSRLQIGLEGPLPTGSMPFDTVSTQDNTIPAAALSKQIVQGDQYVPKKMAPTGYVPKL